MSLLKISDRAIALDVSANLVISTKVRELKKQGVSVVSLYSGEPNFETPKAIIDAAKEALSKEAVNKYTPIRGTDELVQSIQAKFKNTLGLNYDSRQIIASTGVKGSLSLALDVLINPGDEIILLAPYWATYLAQVKFAGGVPVVVSGKIENRYVPSIEDFKRALSSKTKAILINTPNNPAGYVMSENYLSQIMRFLESTSVCVISDEIYEYLLFHNLKHISPATLSENAYKRTLVLIGVAKAYAMTGWRVGVAAGPKELIAAMVKLQGQRYSCITSIAQSVAGFAFRESTPIKEAMINIKKEYCSRCDFLEKIIATLPQISWSKPQGAFFALLDFSALIGKEHRGCELKNDIDLANRLLIEAHVAVVPGSQFGIPNTVRISLSSSLKNIKEGLKRIIKWIDLF